MHDEKNLYPEPGEAQRQYRQRDIDKKNLLTAVREAGIEVVDDDPEEILLAIHRFLAQTDSALAMVELDNLAGEQERVNLPGSIDEYPNRRGRYRVSLGDLHNDPRVTELIRQFARNRSG